MLIRCVYSPNYGAYGRARFFAVIATPDTIESDTTLREIINVANFITTLR